MICKIITSQCKVVVDMSRLRHMSGFIIKLKGALQLSALRGDIAKFE